MNGAEDMIVDHNMVVTQVFRRLGKRLDRPGIAAKFDLRINHTSFHRPLPLSRCEVLRPIQTIHVRSGRAARTRHITLAATRSQITPRDDDRELQSEQRIVGLPARKLQPDRTDARSWLGMTFAKETPAWRASPRSAFGAERTPDGPIKTKWSPAEYHHAGLAEFAPGGKGGVLVAV